MKNIIIILSLITLLILGGCKIGDLFTINPANQWLSSNIEVDKTRLKAYEDSVNVNVEAIRNFDKRDHGAFVYVWIIKNGKVINHVYLDEHEAFSKSYEVTGFENGWNDLTVKLGLSKWRSCGGARYDGSVDCGRSTYYWTSECQYSHDEIKLYSCDLLESKVGVGKKRFTKGNILTTLNEDYSSEIRGLPIITRKYDIAKNIGEPCRRKFLFCWDWLFKLFN